MAGEFGRLGVGMGTLLSAGIMLGIANRVFPRPKPKRRSTRRKAKR